MSFADFKLIGLNRNPTSLYMWGDNTNGLLGDNNTPSYFSWSKISSGGLHTVAIRSDGLLFAWGRNTEGQLGTNDTVHRSSPVQISSTNSWLQVGAGLSHTIAINSDYTLYAWGGNRYGQLGDNTTINKSLPALVGTSSWSVVTAGGNHTVGIKTDNTVFAWGYNGSGQLGDNSISNRSSPVQIGASALLSPTAYSTYFNGTNYVTVSPGANAVFGANPFTIEMWVYHTQTTSLGTQVLAGQNNTSPGGGTSWLWVYDPVQGQAYFQDNSYTSSWLNANIGGISPNQWHHLAIAKDTPSTDSIRMYVDGIQVMIRTGNMNSQNIGSSGDPLGIAGNGRSTPWLGYITNVRITKNQALFAADTSFTPSINPLTTTTVGATGAGAAASLTGTVLLLAEQNTTQLDNSVNAYAITTGGATPTYSLFTPFTSAIPTGSLLALKIAAGKTHTVALATDYTLYAWGDNTYSELGDGTTINRSSPVQIGTSSWSQVSAGGTHTAAIKTDSTLYTWGLNSSGQLGLNNSYSGSYWTQISEGPVHTLAIRNDGTLWSWGRNDQGQLGLSDTINRSSPTQVGTSSWTSIDTGDSHSVAIRSDGTLFTWGSNLFGQLGNNPTPINVTWSKISVNAYGSHIVAIKSNGTLWSWGANAQGQLGTGDLLLKSSPTQIGTNSNWIDVSVGAQHTLGVTNDNVMYAWGLNSGGALGDLTIAARSSPVQIGYNFQKVFAGNNFSTALDINSYLYTWGTNTNGVLGDATTINKSSPILISTSTWTNVSAADHILALKSDSTLYSWGLNAQGQLGLGDLIARSSPVQVGLSSWTSISAGGSFSVAIRSDGSLFTWGSNLYGQLGVNDVTDRNSPIQVGTATPTNVYSLYFNGSNSYLRFNNNTTTVITRNSTDWTVEAWVYISSYGQRYPIYSVYPSVNLGNVNNNFLYIDANGYVVFGLSAVDNVTLSTSNTGTIVSLGTWTHVAFCRQGSSNSNSLYINGNIAASGNGGGNSSNYDNATTSDIHYIGYDGVSLPFSGYITNLRVVVGVQVYTGSYFTVPTTMLTKIQSASTNISAITGTQTLLLTAQNSIIVDNSSYARALTTVGTVSSSVLLPFTILSSAIGTNWVSAAAGISNTTAINSVGNLYAWGFNTTGSLGLGDTLHRSSPTQVGTSTWSTVYSGISFEIAIRSDNSTFAWGGQTFGQLSDYTVIARSSPVQIGTTTANTSSPVQIGTSSWTQISAGGSHTVGITTDGILYGWGRNSEGQLGGAANTLGTIWNKVVIGQSHALGIRSDGKLYAWGSNATGQLGDNTTVAKSSPVLIDSGTWSDIAISQGASLFYSMGIKSDGRLYAWGNNSAGQLGWLSWRQISVGSGHTLLLRSDGQLYAWGNNTQGQLGINDNANRSSPVQVGTSKWSTISAGTSVSAAIRSDSTLWAWGNNINGGVGDGSTASRSSPVQIATASWSQISVKDYIIATNTQGSLFVWGNNNNGQLGIGTTLNKKAPQLLDGTVSSYGVAFDGVGDWLNIISSPNFTFGTSDFTVECWIYPTANTAAQQYTVISNAVATTNDVNWEIQYINGVIRFTPYTVTGAYATVTGVKVLSIFNWYHVAVVRIGTALNIYINGLLDITVTNNANLNAQHTLQIGAELTSGGSYFAGFISNVRVVKGLGVYTGNFIAPTSALTATQTNAGVNISDITGNQTVLLTCQNNTIVDNSNSGFTITPTGTPTTTSANPFGITTTGSTSWTQIAAGTASLAIRNTGALFTWGQNNYGQLGSNTTTNRSSPVQVGTSSWIVVSSSNTGHSLAVDSAYNLYAWGNNQYGELGYNNEYINVSSPVQVLVGYSTTSISAGNNTSIGVTTNNNINTVYAWGLNQADQLNNINAFTWQSVKQGAGLQTSVGSTAGKLYVWGDNTYGQQGVGDTLARSSPVQVGGFTGSATNRLMLTTPLNTAYITNDNSLYMMGDNTYGQLGQNDTISRSSPVLVGVLNAGNWSTVAISGTGHVIGVSTDGSLFAWGNNQYNELGQLDNVVINRSSPVQIGTGSSWAKVSAGNNFSAAIDNTGAIYLWGRNDTGQVGTVTPLSYTQVGAYSAIRNDGKLLTWGTNLSGNLGTNDTVNRSTPTQITTLSNTSTSWIQVSGGYNNTAGIKIDRKLYIWGNNTYGQLGVSDNITRSQAVQIGVSSWTQVYVTASNVYAIRSDNTLWSWGRNNIGQLGINDTLDRSSPVQVGSNNWSMVVASGTHALALRTDGTLYAWGYNQYNELGQNQRVQTNYSSPMQVGTSSFVTISAGTNNSFAIRTDGGLFAWGRTDYGQIGVRSDNTNINIPLSWTSVSGGDSYSVAIRSDGKLFSWGLNNKGQLGLGHTVSKSTPTQIATSTNYNYYSTSFNGTTDFLSMPSSTALSLGTNDFTVECWIYNTATQLTTDKMIFSFWGGAPAPDSYQFLLRGTSNRIEWQIYTQSSPDVASLYVPTNSWNHLAWVRSGTTIYSFINGVLCDTSTGVTNSANGSGGVAYVASQSNTPTFPFQGYISNLRIVKGQSLYTSNFIPSTTPLTTTSQGATASNVSLLTCQNSAFIDNSNTPNVITSTGTGIAVTTTIIPFSYTTPNYSWTQVSTVLSHTVAIRNDGTLWTWGDNSTGQLSQNDTVNRSAPIQIGSSSWTSVFAGRNATYLIGTDGSLFTVGDNTYGQLGQNDNTTRSSIVQVGTSSWTTLSASQTGHVLGITSTGALFAWGNNGYNELGLDPGTSSAFNPYTLHRSSPIQVGTSSWTKVSAGNSFSAAIRTDGGLFTWGRNDQGQLGVATTTYSWTNVAPNNILRSDNKVFVFGDNSSGSLGLGDTSNRSTPVQLTGNSWSLVSSYGNNRHTLAIRTDGWLYAWGPNGSGQLGDGTTVAKSSPVLISTSSWTYVATGNFGASFAIKTDGTLWAWGNNINGVLGLGDTIYRSIPVQVGNSWTAISTGALHTLGLTNDGALWGWGQNTTGELGLVTDVTNKSRPQQIAVGSSFIAVAAGTSFSLFVRNDYKLYGTGYNIYGQVGDGTTVNRSSPVTVGLAIGTSSWTSVSAGNNLGAAIQSGGQLYTWGNNGNGQLGGSSTVAIAAGSATARSTPVQIGPAGSSWTQVSVNPPLGTVLARTITNTVFTWGYNGSGDLGLGDTVNRSAPVQITIPAVTPVLPDLIKSPTQVGTSSWIQINAGSSWAAGILTAGTLYTWGAGVNGELGSNATTSRSSPVQVGALTTWGQLAGNTHVLSITTAGALFAWGTNTTGQLGDNTTVVKSSPVLVAALTGIILDNVSSPSQIGTSSWTVVSAGDYFTSAIRYLDGALFTWGLGNTGQLGSGATASRSSPVQVGTSSWLTVASQGTSNTVAVTIAYTLFGWGNNNNGQVGDNTTVNKSAPAAVGALTNLFMDIMKSPTLISAGSSWSQVSLGDYHALATKSDSTLWSWGKNDQGQLGQNLSIASNRSSPVQIGASTWTVISAGYSISAAITSAGNLQTTGLNTSGQQGTGGVVGRSAFAAVNGTSSWSQVGTGANSIIGVTISNVVFTWGQNDKGQLGLNDTVNRSFPTQLGSNLLASMYQTVYPSPVVLSTGSATSWTQIGIGDSFAAGVDTAGRLYTWGFNAQGQLGDASTINTTPTKSSPSQIATTASSYTFINASSPVQVGTNSWSAITAGATHVNAIRSDGTLWGWGVNTYGQAGTLNTVTQTYPRQIDFTNSWTSIAAGNDFSAGITATTKLLYRWGYYSSNEVAAPYRSAPVQIDNNTFSKVSIVNTTAFAITTGGALYGWGKITTDDNFYFNQVIAAIPWGVGNGYKDVNAGDSFVHAIKNDYTLWTTGANGFGQLGVNDTVTRSSIVQIGSGYSWTLLGGGFNPALTAGSLFVAGNNTTGQLGLSDAVARSSPTQVSATNQPLFAYPNRLGISAWSKVSAGITHTMAIRSDSTLWGWGFNASAQIGDGTSSLRSSPSQVGTSSWLQVSAGKDHSTAIRLDNTLWTWGLNTRGQLGDNSTTTRNSPVQVGTGYWNSVNAGNNHTIGLADNNTMYVWGDDSYGQ